MVSFDGNVYMIRSDAVSLQSDIHSNVHFEAWKTLSIEESIVYMCAKDWNVIQLRRHWQLLETEFGPALLTNSDIFGVGRSKV